MLKKRDFLAIIRIIYITRSNKKTRLRGRYLGKGRNIGKKIISQKIR